MNSFTTTNPTNFNQIGEFHYQGKSEVDDCLQLAQKSYLVWRKLSIEKRVEHFLVLAAKLEEKREFLAHLITEEMGKAITESRAEIDKCAWMIKVYCEKSKEWLKEENVKADGLKHVVRFEPLGVILSIMPWNFPFWQALRFAVPSIIAGNVTLLKHSNQVPKCALSIMELFKEAGFDDGIFQTLIINHSVTESIISSKIIQGVSFTGSTEAGKHISALCGRHLKKQVMELGGADPFIVFEDADIDHAVKGAIIGRFINCGQSCIAAKRFFVHESVMDDFVERFSHAIENIKVGDPTNNETTMGPLVNKKAIEQVSEQVTEAINLGAKLVCGGRPFSVDDKGYFYRPTLLTDIKKEMRIFKEEVFGPVAFVMPFKTEEEAIILANETDFGLGGSVWTGDLTRGERVASEVNSGSVFVNSIVKSDPRMPFGGVKMSGIGRELSHFGLKEFVNIKGYNIYRD